MRSNALKAVRSRRWPVALILSAAALAGSAAPAGAVGPESGLAVGVGTESINAEGEGLPTCLAADAGATYTIDTLEDADGRVTANDSATVYDGPVTITLTVPGVHYINPAGVFNDEDCSNPLVPGTITVTSPDSTSTSGVFDCGSETAFYSRVGTAVVWQGMGDCTVNGDQAGAGTLHTFEGNLLPCVPAPPTEPTTCGDTQIQGVYTETL